MVSSIQPSQHPDDILRDMTVCMCEYIKKGPEMPHRDSETRRENPITMEKMGFLT